MLLWYVIFKDKPQETYCTEERTPRAAVLQRFEHAIALGCTTAARLSACG